MPVSQYGHGTHVGNHRNHNEDNYAIDINAGIGVLADGMGGHEGGEIASQIVVDSICADLLDGKLIVDAITNAHQSVQDAVTNGEGKKGMGSTAIAIKFNDKQYEIGWIGDSRAYCWDGKDLTQLTKDHSLVQSMVDDGFITADEATVHPKRNYLTQSIGMSDSFELKVGHINDNIYRNYQFLLCSDGLSGEVDNDDIKKILELDKSDQQKTNLLINKAIENGGSDNITVILISAPETAPVA